MTENQRVIARLTMGEHQPWDLTEDDTPYIGLLHSFLEEQEDNCGETFHFPLNGLHNINPQAVSMALIVLRSSNMEQTLCEYTMVNVLDCMKVADFLEMNGGNEKNKSKDVLSACAKYIANQIRGKTAEEIKILFEN